MSMKVYRYPEEKEWAQLLKRPTKDAAQLNDTVSSVLREVRERGDEAVREFEERFDKVRLDTLAVSEAEMKEAETLVSLELKAALELAHRNIYTFHAAQRFESRKWHYMLAKGNPHRTCRTLHPRWNCPTVQHSSDACHTCQDSRMQQHCSLHASQP